MIIRPTDLRNPFVYIFYAFKIQLIWTSPGQDITSEEQSRVLDGTDPLQQPEEQPVSVNEDAAPAQKFELENEAKEFTTGLMADLTPNEV